MVDADDTGFGYNTGEWYQVTVRRQGISGSIHISGDALGTRERTC